MNVIKRLDNPCILLFCYFDDINLVFRDMTCDCVSNWSYLT